MKHSRSARPPRAAVAALAAGLTACAARGSSPSGDRRRRQRRQVKIMVGGLDKVIYLPAKLTEQLGYFKDAGRRTSSC